jgi:hypothetical protein
LGGDWWLRVHVCSIIRKYLMLQKKSNHNKWSLINVHSTLNFSVKSKFPSNHMMIAQHDAIEVYHTWGFAFTSPFEKWLLIHLQARRCVLYHMVFLYLWTQIDSSVPSVGISLLILHLTRDLLLWTSHAHAVHAPPTTDKSTYFHTTHD